MVSVIYAEPYSSPDSSTSGDHSSRTSRKYFCFVTSPDKVSDSSDSDKNSQPSSGSSEDHSSTSLKSDFYFVDSLVLSPENDSSDSDKLFEPSSTESSTSRSSTSSSSSSASGSTIVISLGRKLIKQKRRSKVMHRFEPIKEEEEEDENDEIPRRWQAFIAFLCFLMLFGVFCLILSILSQHYKPEIIVQSLDINSFLLGQGSDYTGVPTMMLTTNSSLKMTLHNPATFFGIHVSYTPVNLKFLALTVATGQVTKFFLPRKSKHTVSVTMEGHHVPLYGAGGTLISEKRSGTVELMLEFEIQSRGFVFGKLVKTKLQKHFYCPVLVESHMTKPIDFKQNSCSIT